MIRKEYDIEQITFAGKLAELAAKYHDRVAIVDGEVQYTYAQMQKYSEYLAAGYQQLGIKKGDHVMLQLPNTAGFVFTIFALAKIGAVPIMGLPSLREADLKHMIEFTQPTAYIAADTYLGYDYVELAGRLQQEYPCIKHAIFDTEDAGHLTIQQLYRTVSEPVAEQTVPTDLGFLLLSGGTTSTPKLIPRTQADYLYNAGKAAERCRMNDQTVYLAALTIAHNFALGNAGILGAFLVGGKAILAKTSSPDELLMQIAKQRVTHTGMVPAVVNLMMDMLEWWDEGDISCWQVLQVGGSVLEQSIANRIFATLPCKLQQTFGVAEGIITMTSLDDSKETILSCQGTLISELDEMLIVDDQGQALPPGEYGELIACGPYTIHAYYGAEEANARSFTADGYYRTGDKAMITPEGNLVVTGRITEQINRAGEKIMPIELENCLCGHPLIKEASVVGIPDEIYGHQACAFIITEDDDLDLIAVNGYLKDAGLADYKRIDSMYLVEAFPLTNVGKVNKKKLTEMAVSCQESYQPFKQRAEKENKACLNIRIRKYRLAKS